MAKKKLKAGSKKRGKKDEEKLYAFLASFFMIIGFIVALILKKQDKYVMFYAKQGLVLFIGFIIAIVLKVLPLIGHVLYIILSIIMVVLWIITWVNALSGHQKKTTIVGDIADKIAL